MGLKKVNIGPNRHFHKFKLADNSIVTVAVLKDSFDAILAKDCVFPTYKDAIYLGSVSIIGFETATKELSDSEHATQINGDYWVKIKVYEVSK